MPSDQGRNVSLNLTPQPLPTPPLQEEQQEGPRRAGPVPSKRSRGGDGEDAMQELASKGGFKKWTEEDFGGNIAQAERFLFTRRILKHMRGSSAHHFYREIDKSGACVCVCVCRPSPPGDSIRGPYTGNAVTSEVAPPTWPALTFSPCLRRDRRA